MKEESERYKPKKERIDGERKDKHSEKYTQKAVVKDEVVKRLNI